MKAAHTYDEKLSDYIKTENGGLVAIAVSSVLTTPSNPITGSFIKGIVHQFFFRCSNLIFWIVWGVV